MSLRVSGDAGEHRGSYGNNCRSQLSLLRENIPAHVALFDRAERRYCFLVRQTRDRRLPSLGFSQSLLNRDRQKSIDPIRYKPAESCGYEDEEDGVNQAPAQFVQMLEK